MILKIKKLFTELMTTLKTSVKPRGLSTSPTVIVKPISMLNTRKLVLDYVVKLAQYYSQNSGIDPRAMPVVLPLARLISVVDNYVTNGVEGMVRDKYIDILRDMESTKEALQNVKNATESMIESIEPEEMGE